MLRTPRRDSSRTPVRTHEASPLLQIDGLEVNVVPPGLEQVPLMLVGPSSQVFDVTASNTQIPEIVIDSQIVDANFDPWFESAHHSEVCLYL